MAVITLTKDNFSQEVEHSDRPVAVDFWASWCGPCTRLSPLVDELAGEHPEIKFGKVNVDEQPELAGRFGVMSIPMLVLFKDGKPAATSVGLVPRAALEEFIAK